MPHMKQVYVRIVSITYLFNRRHFIKKEIVFGTMPIKKFSIKSADFKK